jgi:hypothetical protein
MSRGDVLAYRGGDVGGFVAGSRCEIRRQFGEFEWGGEGTSPPVKLIAQVRIFVMAQPFGGMLYHPMEFTTPPIRSEQFRDSNQSHLCPTIAPLPTIEETPIQNRTKAL